MTTDDLRAGAPPPLDRATAELVFSLSVEATDWVPKRYGYSVGELGFLVGEATRSEVMKAPVITPLPHSPAWLRGLMNLRGNLVPVVDLGPLCGQPPEPRSPAMVLVLDSGDKAVAIPIESLPVALSTLEEIAFFPPLPEEAAAHVSAAFSSDGRTWVEFDHGTYFRALAQSFRADPSGTSSRNIKEEAV